MDSALWGMDRMFSCLRKLSLSGTPTAAAAATTTTATAAAATRLDKDHHQHHHHHHHQQQQQQHEERQQKHEHQSQEEDEEEDRQQVQMIASIWSRLPEDCLDRVLARVPLPSLFRLRTVCKRWNSFLVSQPFFSLQSDTASSRSCFLLCTLGRSACAFNFALAGWHIVPIPRILLPITTPPVSVTSASATLLCYANQVADCSTLYVCNPFTKSLRELPPMHRVRLIHKLTILADCAPGSASSSSSSSDSSNPSGAAQTPTSPDGDAAGIPNSAAAARPTPHPGGAANAGGYRIVVTGEEGNNMLSPHVYQLNTEVFDSRSGCWSDAEAPPAEATFGAEPGAWAGGIFYCATELPYGVVAFDPAAAAWSQLRVAMPALVGPPALVSANASRLLMVGRVRSRGGAANIPPPEECARGICSVPGGSGRAAATWNGKDGGAEAAAAAADTVKVWELNGGGWEEAAPPPPAAMCAEFLQPLKMRTPLVCAGVGSMVCVTTHLSPRALLLDVKTGAWRWLPKDPLFPRLRNFHLLAFCFEPRLDLQP